MENLQQYKYTHPHLIESERIELACDYLVHEFRKIFQNIAPDGAYKAIKKIAPTKDSDDISIRDFWNLFSSMSAGWRLKELHIIVTAENIQWKKAEIPIESLIPQTALGWIENIKTYSFRTAIAYLNNNEELLNESIKKRGDRAEGDDNDPIIAIKKNGIFEVADGNSRLNLKIENWVSERRKSKSLKPPMIIAWIGIPNGSPKNYWIPTSSLVFMECFLKKDMEGKLKDFSQLGLIEYSKRVKKP